MTRALAASVVCAAFAEEGGGPRRTVAQMVKFADRQKVAYLVDAARDTRLGRSGLAVLVVLTDLANQVSGECYPTISTIVASSGVPRTSTMRAVARLVGTGWLRCEKRHGARSRYWLTKPASGTSSTRGTSPMRGLWRGRARREGSS